MLRDGRGTPTVHPRVGADLRCWTPAATPLILHAMTLATSGLTALLALTITALPCAAQTADPDSGTFVIRRASDTVAVEHFSRTATKLEGTLAMRDQKGTAQLYQAVVAPDA